MDDDPLWSRWAIPPLLPGATRRELASHAAAETSARNEIRWIWNELCSGLDLTRRVVPTGTITREPPRIGRIELGPPTRFTVELRPGQMRQDIAAHAARIAAAYEVSDVAVSHLVRGWIVVELVEHRRVRPAAPAGDTPPGSDGAPPPTHLPRRDRRGPWGRPRSWMPRRSRPHGA